MSKKGYKQTKEHKINISNSMKGHIFSKETKEKLRKNHKGMLGKKFSKESIIKLSLAKKGKKFTKEHIKNLSLSHIKEKCYNWHGGISFEPYGLEFNNKLREQIRKRDNYRCQECGFNQKQLKRKLSIHHIDFNKQNNNYNNLISLCNTCHTQTNYNRNDWISYFQDKIIEM